MKRIHPLAIGLAAVAALGGLSAWSTHRYFHHTLPLHLFAKIKQAHPTNNGGWINHVPIKTVVGDYLIVSYVGGLTFKNGKRLLFQLAEDGKLIHQSLA